MRKPIFYNEKKFGFNTFSVWRKRYTVVLHEGSNIEYYDPILENTFPLHMEGNIEVIQFMNI